MSIKPIKKIAIVGIHTGVGKTVASAIIAEALGADYWKPVQSGADERDTTLVWQLLSNGHQRVHPEAVLLKEPISPHAAAALEGVEVDFTKFQWPQTDKLLIVETAGGVLSPINSHQTMLDFVAYADMPVILVAKHYLGSITHTLTAVEVLKSRNIPLLGMVVSGDTLESSESFIEQYTNLNFSARIPQIIEITPEYIRVLAKQLSEDINKSLILNSID